MIGMNNINRLIRYIKNHDERLSLDQEIELLFNFFKMNIERIEEIKFNYDENLLAGTKLSLKDNNQVDYGMTKDLGILLSIIINALIKNITEEEIVDYIMMDKPSEGINHFIEMISKFRVDEDSINRDSICSYLFRKLSTDKKLNILNNNESFSDYLFNQFFMSLPKEEAIRIIKERKYSGKIDAYNNYDFISQLDKDEIFELLNQDYIIDSLDSYYLQMLIQLLDEKDKLLILKNDNIINKLEEWSLANIVKSINQDKIVEIFNNKTIADKLGSYAIDVLDDLNEDLALGILLNPSIISQIDTFKLEWFLRDKSEHFIKEFLSNFDKISKYIKESSYYFKTIDLLERITNENDIIEFLKINSITNRLDERDIVELIRILKSEENKYTVLCMPNILSILSIYDIENIMIYGAFSRELLVRCIKTESILSRLIVSYSLDRIIDLLDEEDKLELLKDDMIVEKISNRSLYNIIDKLEKEKQYEFFANKKIFIKLIADHTFNAIPIIKKIHDEDLMKFIDDDEVFESLNYYYLREVLRNLSKENLKVALSYKKIKDKVFGVEYDYFEALTFSEEERYEYLIKNLNNLSNESLLIIVNTFEQNDLMRKLLTNKELFDRVFFYPNDLKNFIAKLDENDPENSVTIKNMLENPFFLRFAMDEPSIVLKYIPENERGVFERIIMSNSLELQKIGNRIMFPLFAQNLSSEELEFKFNEIEEIFIRNNIPFFAKLFLCFQRLYPNLSKFEGKIQKFDFNDGSRMSQQLQDEEILKMIFRNEKSLEEAKAILDGPKTELKEKIQKKMIEIRFGIIFNDLLRIAIGSNNRSLREYLNNIERGNEIFLQIKDNKRKVESLSEKEREILEVFLSHLEVLYSNMKNKKDVSLNEEDLIDRINRYSSLFTTTDRYSLPDRIVRSFCYYGGYKSFKELKDAIDRSLEETNKKNERNAKEIEGRTFKLEAGDFIRGIGSISSLPCLNDGNVCKEFLGPILGTSNSDTTPLDTDWTRLQPRDIEENIEGTLSGTPTGFGFGSIFFVIKSNNLPSSNYIITRDVDGPKEERYNPLKIEMFQTGYESHYGARTGTSTADVDYIIFNENCTTDMEPAHLTLSAIKTELIKTGIYIPIVNMEGQLVFTKEEFDRLKNKLCGLKRYGYDRFIPSSYSMDFGKTEFMMDDKTISIPSIEEIELMIRNDDDRREYEYSKIISHLSKYVKDNTKARELFTTLTGDFSDGIAELIGTGSTARGTNVPNDADYDFILRLDSSDMDRHLDLVSKLDAYLKPKERIPGKSQRFRGKGITNVEGLEGQEVDIDVTFSGKTNKMEYSTDSALEERMNAIKTQYPELYDKVRANIVAAKMLLKQAHAYKAYKSDHNQGGLGGVGVENWILQNNGSLLQAIDEFLSYAVKDGKIIDFSEFKKTYHIWDYGANHEPKNNAYPFDEFVDYNMTKEGYERMCKVLIEFKKQLASNKDLREQYALL